MKHPIIRGSIRCNVECDICGEEVNFLLQIGFSADRDSDKKYCLKCKQDLFDRISNGEI